MEHADPASPNTDKPLRPVRYRPSIIGALFLVVLDGFLLLPGLGVIIALLILTGCWVTAVVRIFFRPSGVLPAFLKGLIYLAAILAIGGVMHLQQWIANQRGAQVVAAVEAFHRAHGDYPGELQELVPEYLGSIPRPALRILAGKYHYLHNEKVTALTWYPLPPTISETYDFRAGKQQRMIRD